MTTEEPFRCHRCRVRFTTNPVTQRCDECEVAVVTDETFRPPLDPPGERGPDGAQGPTGDVLDPDGVRIGPA